MSGISPISSYSYSSYTDYGKFASGKKIVSASDGAAELSIIQKMDAQSKGLDAGSKNIATTKDMLNVADGALASLHDSLSRIRELGLQASNSALYSKDELSMMQIEIDEIKKGISDIAKNTQFNGLKLLDGSMADINLATNPTGKGQEIKMVNASLEALGIADFDVTKDFNLKDVDNALKKVNEARSDIGAKSNRLAYTIMSNQYSSYNLTSANSQIRDTDMAEEMSDLQKNSILEQIRINMQKKQMEEEQQRRNNFFV